MAIPVLLARYAAGKIAKYAVDKAITLAGTELAEKVPQLASPNGAGQLGEDNQSAVLENCGKLEGSMIGKGVSPGDILSTPKMAAAATRLLSARPGNAAGAWSQFRESLAQSVESGMVALTEKNAEGLGVHSSFMRRQTSLAKQMQHAQENGMGIPAGATPPKFA